MNVEDVECSIILKNFNNIKLIAIEYLHKVLVILTNLILQG